MQETLKIFDEHYKEIGRATRDTVHKKGYWHEVFHCWLLQKVENEWKIYLQLRSRNKKDYPGQLDITAAGHLMADETVKDGIRELKEEIGLDVSYDQLIPLGVLPYIIDNENIRDFEFAHVFIYLFDGTFDDFTIQVAELDGMYQGSFQAFSDLVRGQKTSLTVTGFDMQQNSKDLHTKDISLADMLALPQSYLNELLKKIEIILR